MSVGWTDKTEFNQLSYQLAHVRDPQEFASRVALLLRIRWPELGPASPPLRALGPRLALPRPEHPEHPEVVVLSYVFPGPDLDDAQVQPCLRDLQALGERGPRMTTLLLVHNQDGRSRLFRDAVTAAFAPLLAAGRAKEARILSRELLLQLAFEAMVDRVEDAVLRCSAAVTAAADWLAPLPAVPLSRSTLRTDRYRLLDASPPAPQVADPVELLFAPDAPGVTFLIGEAGFGKTTTALRSFADARYRVLYLAGSQISPTLCTKSLLMQCLPDDDELFARAAPEDRPTLQRIARPVFESLLKRQGSRIALILDGLDESFFLTRRGGVQILLNLLRELHARVVLSARTEYWYARQGDFAALFGIVAPSSRHQRDVRLIELLPWEEPQIAALARRFQAGLLDPAQRERVGHLIDCIEGGAYRSYYGDIPRRPLFLRFILETVAHSDVHQVGRARLFAEWAHLKILRDAASGRPPILDEQGGDATAVLAFRAMELAAAQMTRQQDGELLLLPTCALADVLQRDPLLQPIVEPTGLLLNSLLLPTAPLSPLRPLEVRFAHRAYQEFFLARHLLRHPRPQVALPDSVQRWVDDLQREDLAPAPALTPPAVTPSAPAPAVPASPPRLDLPRLFRWEDLTLYRIDGHCVSVRVGAGSCRRYSYLDLGLASQKNREPTRPWALLEQVCDQGSYRPAPARHAADKTQLSVLRAALQRLFGCEGDPFLPYDAQAGWRPRFRVYPHPPSERGQFEDPA